MALPKTWTRPDGSVRVIDERPLLTPDEVADRLGIPKASLYGWWSRGAPAPARSRIGRHIRVSEDDLAQFIESRKVEGRQSA